MTTVDVRRVDGSVAGTVELDEATFAMLRGLEERRFMPAGASRPS